MKRVLLSISFDGTKYHGWQIQPNAVTVQEVLEDSLLKLLGKPTGVTSCSRTDAGVHAKEFYIHLDCEDSIPDCAFLKGLNAILPSDISVKCIKTVQNDFHARYNARGKTYLYNIYNSSLKDAFLSRYSWHIDRPLDIDKMNIFCKSIIGTHDFFAFSSSGRSVEDTVRTVSDCYIEKCGDMLSLRITANGFLYNMVRIVVGTAVGVSDGKINVDDIPQIIADKNRDGLGITAPPHGLFLEKVYY